MNENMQSKSIQMKVVNNSISFSLSTNDIQLKSLQF